MNIYTGQSFQYSICSAINEGPIIKVLKVFNTPIWATEFTCGAFRFIRRPQLMTCKLNLKSLLCCERDSKPKDHDSTPYPLRYSFTKNKYLPQSANEVAGCLIVIVFSGHFLHCSPPNSTYSTKEQLTQPDGVYAWPSLQ